ncbi:LysR family transcriptional regulator [Verticiella sediminum]|uniref:LysR family transcriptional regulator n=1 Tax=Verticiella sediminum TaxID=1247510 RepID=A0A556ABX2_9BURK|nr:LysR family transcriptional regulator [Verticiella sediminum]TSH90367.1 LysR family transcriptional regulator [Verticiella sediminum]
MNLRFLETFVWVARLRSFKAAAHKLNLTQAAISGRIAALENELNQQLLERGARDTRLTPAGRTLMEYARRMLDTDAEMRRTLLGPPGLRGRVRLGIVESIVHTWFTPFITHLHEKHPEIEFELTAESTRRLQDLLKHGSIDVALQTDSIIGADVRNRDLGALRMGWIVGAHTPFPDEMALADLATFPLVTFPRHSQPHLQLLDLLEAAGIVHARIHFVSSIAACLQFAEAGLGIAALPVAAAQAGLAEGRYRRIRTQPEQADLRLVASWRPEGDGGVADAVVQLAVEEMQRYAAVCPHATPAPQPGAPQGNTG